MAVSSSINVCPPCNVRISRSIPDHMLDTESERSKFFDDATCLAGEISQNQTFYAVKPLLNFWAAFTPSAEVSINSTTFQFPFLTL